MSIDDEDDYGKPWQEIARRWQASSEEWQDIANTEERRCTNLGTNLGTILIGSLLFNLVLLLLMIVRSLTTEAR